MRGLFLWRLGNSPYRSVNDARIVGIETKLGRAVAIVSIENFSPALAAIRGFVNAAMLAGRDVANRRDVNNIGILRIHEDRRNRSRFAYSDIRPSGARIGGFPDAVPGRLFARRHINDVWIRWRHHQVGNRGDVRVVKYRNPRHPSVRSFPHASPRRAHVIRFQIARDARYSGDSAATMWPDQPPGMPFHLVRG